MEPKNAFVSPTRQTNNEKHTLIPNYFKSINLELQTSSSGITFCDSAAKVDICKTICQSDAGECAFNGICLCRDNWSGFMNLSMPNVRHEIPSDHSECSKRCSLVKFLLHTFQCN